VGTNWVATTLAGLANPSDIATDPFENLYIAGQNSFVIYKLTPDGTNWLLTTIAGFKPGSNDGTGSAAGFLAPHGITMDNAGNLFVVDDSLNNIRKGWSSDAPPAATLSPPLISGGQVQLNFVVSTGSPTNFTLLQSAGIDAAWSTNTSMVLTTNIAGLYYQLSAPPDNELSEFYRLQLQ
jgi:hypothetical protein